MNYLILGAAGLIGSNLSSFLKAKGHQLQEIDIAYSPQQDLRIYENKFVIEAIEKCDFVFFLAFDVGGYKYLQKNQYGFAFIDNNIRIQANVFELLKRYNKKFIFTSTQLSAVRYLPYGTLKIVGEHYTESLGGLVARLWNVYGKETTGNKAHVITDFIQMAKEKKQIKMLTDGSEERQFLYVTDCVEALITLMENYESIDRKMPLHITSFEWISIRNVAEVISKLMNNIPIIEGNYQDSVQIHNKNEPEKDILTIWQPKTNLVQGINQLINIL
jgi:nucleoside-diphosphate-sugar epimerase